MEIGEGPAEVLTLPDVSVTNVHSINLGRGYRLFVRLPADYYAETSARRRYPTIYLLDSQWHYVLFRSVLTNLRFDLAVPEAVLVGIAWGIEGTESANEHRFEDFLHTKVAGFDGSGCSDRFQQFLEEELLVYVESFYRVNNQRVLVGASASAQFVLHTLATRPELFNGYMALSPTPLLVDELIEKFNTVYERQQYDQTRKLFLCIGGNEKLTSFSGFSDFLAQKNYKNFLFSSKVISDAHHSGVLAEGFTRGLLFLFKSDQISIPFNVIELYQGIYESLENSSSRLYFWVQDGVLCTSSTVTDIIRLTAKSFTEFQIPGEPIELTFCCLEEGSPTDLEVLVNLNKTCYRKIKEADVIVASLHVGNS